MHLFPPIHYNKLSLKKQNVWRRNLFIQFALWFVWWKRILSVILLHLQNNSIMLSLLASGMPAGLLFPNCTVYLLSVMPQTFPSLVSELNSWFYKFLVYTRRWKVPSSRCSLVHSVSLHKLFVQKLTHLAPCLYVQG